jgi:hypothetical protein
MYLPLPELPIVDVLSLRFGLELKQVNWLKENCPDTVDVLQAASVVFGEVTVARLVIRRKRGSYKTFESSEYQLLKEQRVRGRLNRRASHRRALIAAKAARLEEQQRRDQVLKSYGIKA